LIVPHGPELAAVRRGLTSGRAGKGCPLPIPIPAGASCAAALDVALERYAAGDCVILIGMCGSLSPDLPVGAVVRYRSCVAADGRELVCDTDLTIEIAAALDRLASAVEPSLSPLVRGVTVERAVSKASEKIALAQASGADVVDMEGAYVLERCEARGIRCAIVRVVSDGSRDDLPDLSGAFDTRGNLRPVALALSFARAPRAALRFILGSAGALRVLRRVASALGNDT
jgi:hypothetical protein